MKKLLMLLMVGLLAGCGGSNMFYVLTADGPAPAGGGRGIGVGPVTLAEYLDRPNVVMQDGPNSLVVPDDHRWAGELSDGVARVMAANLGRRLHSGNVRIYPWDRDEEISRQVTIDVVQLHGGADGKALLEAVYRIYSLPDRRIVTTKRFMATEPLEKDGYDALVAAESRLLSRMADEMMKGMR